jgi:hypothetical protein
LEHDAANAAALAEADANKTAEEASSKKNEHRRKRYRERFDEDDVMTNPRSKRSSLTKISWRRRSSDRHRQRYAGMSGISGTYGWRCRASNTGCSAQAEVPHGNAPYYAFTNEDAMDNCVEGFEAAARS